MGNKKLFSEFPPVSKQAWIDQVVKDLKGGDFDKKLVWQTDDKFAVQPFYTAEDMKGIDVASNLGSFLPCDENAAGPRSWANLTEVTVDSPEQANKDALGFLSERGADGVIFNLKGENTDFAKLLKGIDCTACVIAFKKVKCSAEVIAAYFDYLKKANIDLKKINGYVNFDPVGLWTRRGEKADFECLAKAVKFAGEAPSFYAFAAKSGSFVNAGANYTQELGYTLAKIVAYIDELEKYGVSAKEVFENCLPVLSLNTDYFFEIAKIRAFRLMLIGLTQAYKADVCAKKIKIASVSSVWAASTYDPYTNMLRTTTETMAAVLGGVDYLYTAPYDTTFAHPTSFSRRIALNNSIIVKEESYFDKVTDPAAGSYYVENLTYRLIQSSLGLFKDIEAKGGFIKLFEGGEIQKAIGEVRDAKRRDIATRKKTYVGVNRYPNNKEILENPECCGGQKCKCNMDESGRLELLPRQHAAKPYECLRKRTELFTREKGKRPSVYLACFGNPAMRTARAMFAGDFFGVAGFEVLPEGFYKNGKEAGTEAAKADADIVVMCSSDDDYIAEGEDFARTFKAGSGKILVLAGFPAEHVEELKKAGVDEFIHVKVNTLELLNDFQVKLGIKK